MGGLRHAAARIVYVVDEPNRYGFANGTLPHHPVAGEEAFLVEQDEGGNVSFEIEVFSRPRHPLARLESPSPGWSRKRRPAGICGECSKPAGPRRKVPPVSRGHFELLGVAA